MAEEVTPTQTNSRIAEQSTDAIYLSSIVEESPCSNKYRIITFP